MVTHPPGYCASAATLASLERVLAVRPSWSGVETAAAALGLGPRTLLHAGPPLRDPTRPPAPLLSSAVIACLLEGWAGSADDAEALVRHGEVVLSSAQTWARVPQRAPADSRADTQAQASQLAAPQTAPQTSPQTLPPRLPNASPATIGCVLPLAFVASPSTPLCRVADAGASGLVRYAPLPTLGGPDTRMGYRDASLAGRLRARDDMLAPDVQALLGAHGPIMLSPMAAQGLASGDDLHSRTTAANLALAGWFRDHAAAALADRLEASPLFFLTMWMAACSLMLAAGEGVEGSTLVTRAGGNGECFGIVLAGAPDRWFTVDAEPPLGHLIASLPHGTPICGAIGDSAVIDILGLGAQRLTLAPEPLAAVARFVEADLTGRAEALLLAPHHEIAPHWPLGLDAAAVGALARAPLVSLSLVAADGLVGFAGRGVYKPPVSLFTEAASAIDP